jgi:peptide deformylase
MKIVNYPHPSLRHLARPLNSIDKKVRRLVGEMLELMYAGRGLGLAGPQVVLPYRVFVMNLKADPLEKEFEKIYINPVIMERKGSVEGEEGCLSFPGLFQKVRRAREIRAQAYDLNGELVEVHACDLEARVWLHEVDHLDGDLFIDKVGPAAKIASRSAIKKLERDFRKAQERGEVAPDADIERLLFALETEPNGGASALRA